MIKTKCVRNIKKMITGLMWRMPSSLVLMLHHVNNTPEFQRSGCLLNTDYFFKLISQFNSFIKCEDLLLKRRGKLSQQIAITFDDGLADVYAIAYPYLKQKNIPFTVFIVSDFIDEEGYLTKEQLIELSKDSLVTIGSHGVSHKVLTGLTAEQKWCEINESKAVLEKIISKRVGLFAYSHGQYDKECLDMVEKAGYFAAFGVKGLPVNCYTRLWKYHLPRYNVVDERHESIDAVVKSFLKGTGKMK